MTHPETITKVMCPAMLEFRNTPDLHEDDCNLCDGRDWVFAVKEIEGLTFAPIPCHYDKGDLPCEECSTARPCPRKPR